MKSQISNPKFQTGGPLTPAKRTGRPRALFVAKNALHDKNLNDKSRRGRLTASRLAATAPPPIVHFDHIRYNPVKFGHSPTSKRSAVLIVSSLGIAIGLSNLNGVVGMPENLNSMISTTRRWSCRIAGVRCVLRGWIVFLIVGMPCAPHARGDDWPQWGGPRRDLVWRESGVAESLPEGTLPRVWAKPISGGYAGPAVADGRVFVTDRLAEQDLERVLCFDADDGTELWKRQYEAPYSISYPVGPRVTPTVDGDRVYALGAVGHLKCLDVKSGDVVWEKHLPTDFGTKLPIWGMAAAPLVDGEQLIVMAGGANGALVVSFDKRTGEEKWRALDDPAVGYAPPVIFEIGGRRQLIVWHATAISSLDPATGKVLWEHPMAVQEALAIATPRQIGNRLFVSSFYQGPLMLDLGDDGLSPRVVWETSAGENELKNTTIHTIMPTPIATEQYLFGVSSYGQLRCVETATGRMVWETRQPTGEGRWWNAFLIPHGEMSGKRVYLANEQGELILAEFSGEGYRELGRAKLIEPTQPIQRRKTVWSHPAFAMKSVFARNDKELIRVNLEEPANHANGRE